MNYCEIYLITKKGKKENYTSLTFLENRDDIQYLEIKNYKEKNLIFNKNIEIIKIRNSLIDQFPLINKNIRIIEIIQSKIQKIPDLSNYKNLEELTIKDSYIKTIEYSFPKNLKNLNLEYNQIDDTFFNNLDFFPLELININIGHNFITKHPPMIICNKVKYDNNNIEEKKIFTVMIDDIMWNINKYTTQHNNQRNQYNNQYNNQHNNQHNNQILIPLFDNNIDQNNNQMLIPLFNNNFEQHIKNVITQKNMFNTTQTVHISSINDSASKSIEKILELTKNYPVQTQQKFINELFYEFYGIYIYRIIFYQNKITFINNMISDISIQSKMHITYNDLLERIWQLIKNHSEKNNLIERLKTEIHDSYLYCFTGRINRLINSLTGFIEGVGITISEKEEVQNEITIIIKKFGEKKILKEEALKGMNEIFNGRNLEENYKNAWIEALEDY